MRRYTFDLLSDIVRLAGELGARGVIMSPGKASPLFPPSDDELFGYYFAALDRLCPIAEKAGTSLWIENVPTTWIPTIDGLMASLKRYGNDAVRIIYDIANAYFIAEDFADGLKQCRERLELVHLSDTGQKLFRHDPVGAWDLPFAQSAGRAQGGRLRQTLHARNHLARCRTATSSIAPTSWPPWVLPSFGPRWSGVTAEATYRRRRGRRRRQRACRRDRSASGRRAASC